VFKKEHECIVKGSS